jgi:hypothetical protein
MRENILERYDLLANYIEAVVHTLPYASTKCVVKSFILIKSFEQPNTHVRGFMFILQK